MLTLKNLHKEYQAGSDKVQALKDVSIELRKAEFVSVLGPSGCGKTTLLNIIGGLDRYTKGDIIINGMSTKKFKDRDWDAYRNHSIGFVFQSYNLIPHLTVLENVEMALTLAGCGKKRRVQICTAALKKVGLSTQLKKKPNQLSGGQMQRVAIARALVNNPDIILADEPTGALDTTTSVQIMEILKRVAKNKLVIMVTHNRELAEEYSTRIVSLLDGKIVGDTNPYHTTPTTELSTRPKMKSKMSFWTALYISMKNLFTKKGRTFMTSFAGSIGIIGIALVLAINSGFTGYIDKLETEALSGYPLTISTAVVDYDKFSSVDLNQEEAEEQENNVATPYNPAQRFIEFGHYNYISKDFVDYVKEYEALDLEKGEDSRDLSLVDYSYYTPLKVVYKNYADAYKFYMVKNQTSVMSGSSRDIFYQMPSNKDFVLGGYDLIYGTYAEKKDDDPTAVEIMLVVEDGNKIGLDIVDLLGLELKTTDGVYENIDFDEILNREYKLLYNDDYYTPNSANFDEITSFAKLDTTNQTALGTLYGNSTTTLKISGVLRAKKDNETPFLNTGLAFLPELSTYYNANCQNSLIGRKQIANKSAYSFYDPFVFSISEMSMLIPASGFDNCASINAFLNASYGFSMDNEQSFDLGIQQIGISDIPSSVYLYPKDFSGKDNIQKMIDDWNAKSENEGNQIMANDTTDMLSNTLGKLVNIVSYVLIAFAGISLIVSSIMISIISYVSVIERTKEIGVLRSLGARKIDISNVFNAETFFIGALSGCLGVGLTYLLSIPINAIINNFAGGSISNVASLNPLHALILIVLSIGLTLFAGLIPSRIAAKKDPVVALRTE